MSRLLAYAIAAAAVAAGAYFLWVNLGSSSAPTYRTEAVARGDITQTVSANGTLKPVKVVNVGAQISGRISALHADFNDQVSEGQVLAELDDALLKAQLDQSVAQLESAKAQLGLAQVNYARAKDLAAKGAGARAALDEAAAGLAIAEAAVGSAEAKVAIDRVNLGYAVIRSPVAGVVMSRDVDVGQTVAASLSAPQIFSIAQNLAQMQIDTTVAEADVGAIRAGMAAVFRVDAFSGRIFHGTVRQIRLNPKTESNVVSYNVVLDVKNDDLTLLPGMTAYVQIEVAEAKAVLLIPNGALRFKPADAAAGSRGGGRNGGDGTRTIYVLENGEPRPVQVTTGITDGRVTEVTGEALKEGDAVITGSSSTAAKSATQTTRMGPPGMF